ncbi:hypothetical protein K438DRAFT_775011 [Mycena galopus ATCC 62051]|nr:hypothetical protein K438DRAFT_775011 [Mycena galopus ATCC 62051]
MAKFPGTSIGIYGTVAAQTSPQASLTFRVDNSITGTYTALDGMTSDVHHQELWMSPSLTNGSHTLVITQTAAQTVGVIFLDYFLYNTSSTAVDAYFIDDRDARITYSPPWRLFGSDPDFMHTSQGSTQSGDSFSLQFKGKGISMWAGINNGTVGQVLNASLTIDGGPPIFFVPPTQTASVTTNNLIFDSGELLDGTHTLVCTAENGHTVWTDYFLVKPGTASASAPASSSGSASTTSSPSPSAPKHTSAIVGGVVGAAVLLIAVVAALFFLRRRKRRRTQAVDFHLDLSQLPTHMTPFSDLVGSEAAVLTPFTPSHAYSAVSLVDSTPALTSDNQPSSRNTSYTGNSNMNPDLRPGLGSRAVSGKHALAVPERESDVSHSGVVSSQDAPPEYFE